MRAIWKAKTGDLALAGTVPGRRRGGALRREKTCPSAYSTALALAVSLVVVADDLGWGRR